MGCTIIKMASSVQGTVPDQTWGQNLPGYFKDNVKPFVHGSSYLIPHDNPSIPNIVNKSTVGMVNDRGFIDAPVRRKDTVRAYIENPSSYVARLHPHDMTSGMGGIENLSNLHNFGHPTPVVNGEDYNDTLYWARGETARERKDPLSAGYAQQVLGPDGSALIEQMRQDQARQYMKERYRQGLVQTAFEGPATVTAQEAEVKYNKDMEEYEADLQQYEADLQEWADSTGGDETNYPGERPTPPRLPSLAEGEQDAAMDGPTGQVRGGRVAAAGMSREPTTMARNLTESRQVDYINGSWVQPASATYSNSLLTTNAGRYRQFNPRITDPAGVRSAFANGGTGWGGGAPSQIEASTDAQRRRYDNVGAGRFASRLETEALAAGLSRLAQRVDDNQIDGNRPQPVDLAELGSLSISTPLRADDRKLLYGVSGPSQDMASRFDNGADVGLNANAQAEQGGAGAGGAANRPRRITQPPDRFGWL